METLLWANSDLHKHLSSLLGFVIACRHYPFPRSLPGLLGLIIKYSLKTQSRRNQFCFHLRGEQHRDLSVVSPKPAPPSVPCSQWVDSVNRSDEQKGAQSFAAAFSASWNSAQFSGARHGLAPSPGEDRELPSAAKRGWAAREGCLQVGKEKWQHTVLSRGRGRKQSPSTQ